MAKVKKVSECFRLGPENGPPKFFLAYGPDLGFVQDAVDSLTKAFVDKYNNIEVRRFIDSDLVADFSSFENSITNSSLFGGANLAIIRLQNEQLSSKIVELIQRLESQGFVLSGGCYIVGSDFSTKSKLVQCFENSRIAAALRFYPPERTDFIQLVKKCAIEEGVDIDNQTTELIVERAPQDSPSISSQIRSLALYVGIGGKIDENAYNALCGNSRESSIEEVLLAAFSGDRGLAIVRSNQCFNGGANGIVILNQLIRRVKMLLTLRDAVDNGASVNEVVEDKRNGVFWKEQPTIARQLSIWPRAALERVLSRAIDTDIECKKRGANSDLLVENTINGIAEFAAGRR